MELMYKFAVEKIAKDLVKSMTLDHDSRGVECAIEAVNLLLEYIERPELRALYLDVRQKLFNMNK